MSNRDRKKIEFIQLCFSAVVNKLEERYGPDNLDLVMEALLEIVTSKLKATTFMADNSYAHESFDASVWLKTKASGPIKKNKAKKQIYSRKTGAQLTAKNTTALHCYHVYVV